MEIKNYVCFEEEREGNKFKLVIPANAPLADVYQCLLVFADKTLSLMKEHVDKYHPSEENSHEEPQCNKESE